MSHENPWATVDDNRNRSQWSSNKQKYNIKSRGTPKKTSWSPSTNNNTNNNTNINNNNNNPIPSNEPNTTDATIWELPKNASDWGTAPVDMNQDTWGSDAVEENWGAVETGVIPLPEQDWEFQDPEAPLQLTSINLEAIAHPVADWTIRVKSSHEFYRQIKNKQIEQWVLHGTEEKEVPNLRCKGVRGPWRPFSNRKHSQATPYS